MNATEIKIMGAQTIDRLKELAEEIAGYSRLSESGRIKLNFAIANRAKVITRMNAQQRALAKAQGGAK